MKKYKLTKVINQNDTNNFIYGIFCVLLGIVCIIFQERIFDYIGIILGVFLIVSGIVGLLKKNNTIYNLIMIIVGVIFSFTGFFKDLIIIIMIVAGIYLIYTSIITFIAANELSKNEPQSKILIIISAITRFILGVLLIVAGSSVINVAFILVGIIAIINGLITIFETYKSIK